MKKIKPGTVVYYHCDVHPGAYGVAYYVNKHDKGHRVTSVLHRNRKSSILCYNVKEVLLEDPMNPKNNNE